ncbi:MFS transporter [Petropleomorpha daqingensis]|uniref:MFS family permease n=1 Tax=Petropleomorpha daqingensis TaxID=2026353 RepID=A0A853CAE0_9ACTN|nr:MFS transporter [Petropleomorpha daqingensis]NYJ03986.1 MFS family permease [Petropleomorpha daqingensis]
MPARRSSPRLVLLVLSAAVAAFAVLQSLVTPVLPTLRAALHTDPSTVTWVLTAWLLAAAVATPVLGRVGDMVGKHRMLVWALAVIAVGLLVSALAPTVGVLIAGRVLQGAGGAVFAVSFGILRDEFPRERLATAVGALSSVIAVGSGLGTVLAGPVVDAFGWRWLFGIPFVLVVVIAVLAARFVPASPVRTPGRVNLAAAALLTGWLLALLLPLSLGHTWGWASPRTIGLLVLAVVLFAGWVGLELRSRTPLIDVRMLQLPAVRTTNAVALLFGAAMFGVFAFLPQFVQVPAASGYGFGDSVTVAGLVLLPMLVTMAVGGALSGRLTAVLGPKPQLVASSLLGLVACLGLAFLHGAQWQLAVAGGVFGIGAGVGYAAITMLIVANVPSAQTGAANGMSANVRTIGGALGTAVLSSLLAGGVDATGLPVESAFTAAFLVLAGASLVAALLALRVPSPARVAAPVVPLVDPAPEAAAA